MLTAATAHTDAQNAKPEDASTAGKKADGAEGEKKLRLAIEEACLEVMRFAGANEIVEVDVRGEILLTGIGEKITRDAMLRVRRSRSESSRARMKELRLRIAVVERDDQSALHDVADVVVHRLPLQRNVGELSVM